MIRFILTAVTALFLLACCTSTPDGRRRLTVSIPAQKWLLDSIVGNRFEVLSMLSDGANPEVFEPSISQMTSMEHSEAYFTVGGLPFEQATMHRIKENFPSMRIIDPDRYIDHVTGTHHHHHGDECHDDGADPHTWSSLRNARAMARAMYEDVVRLDPAGKKYYTARYRDLDHHLKELDDSVAAALRPYHGRAVLVWHPSLSYFVRDYGLKQISIENEGKEASPAQYRRQIDLARSQEPLVFFLQREFDSRQGASMAEELGLRTAEISVMEADIPRQIRKLTNDITSASHN